MHRIIRGVFFCGMWASFTLSAVAAEPGVKMPPGKKLDLTFVPADAFAAAVAHPQRVITSPAFEIWPTEIFSAGGSKEWGFDPLQIDEVVAVAGLPQPLPTPRLGIVLRFLQPQDVQRVLTTLVSTGQDGEIDGKRARFAGLPFQTSGAFIDDRTLVIGTEDGVRWVVTANGGDSPLRKQMAAADATPDAALFINVEPVRPLLMQGLGAGAATGRIPPQFMGLTKLPELIDFLELRLCNAAAPDSAIELDLTANNPQNAAEVQRLVKQGLEGGKAAVVVQMTEQADHQPNERELNKAMLHYVNRIGDKLIKALEPKQNGNHLLIRSELQGGAAEIAVVTALLLPATQAARAAAQRNVSQNNLKQIALSMLNYEDQHHVLPPRAFFDKDGKPLLSWRVMMLPDMDEGDLFQQFHFDEPWDSEHNKTLIEKMPEAYKDPRFDLPPGMTIYQAVVGKGCVFEGDKGIKLAQLTDGTSKTAGVVAVSPNKAVPWTKPEDWEFDAKNPLRDLDNPSPGGIIQLMFMDGHIEGVGSDIDPKILKAVFTRNGGEAVNLP